MILKPSPTDRPHLSPHGYMAFSEAIIKGGASLPLHPFIEVVLQYLNVAPFQFTPNSFRIIVVFFIAFTEASHITPMVNKFAYVFEIKAFTKHAGFWYATNRGVDVQGIGGLRSNMGQWKDKFFFYPSRRPGEFRTACTWQPVCCPSSTWLSLYFSNSFFFADPHPRLMLEE